MLLVKLNQQNSSSMKKLIGSLTFFLLYCALGAQSVGINTDGSTPNSDAALHIKSTNKGMVIPSMSTSQRTSISNVSNGLLVYDTNTNSFWYRDSGTWHEILSDTYVPGSPDEMVDSDNNTKVQVEEVANDDQIRFDIDGAEVLVVKENAYGVPMLHLPDGGATNGLFIGHDAGLNNNTVSFDGRYNTFLGYEAGTENISGSYNTCLGESAGQRSETGDWNTFLGARAAENIDASSNNTIVGTFSGQNQTQGDHNTYLGYAAGRDIGIGDDNTLLGYEAGKRLGNSSGNIMIGYQAGWNAMNVNDKLYIDNSSTVNPLLYGDFALNELQSNGVFSVNYPTSSSNTNMQLFFEIINVKKFSMGYNSTANYFVIKDEVNNDQVFYIQNGKVGIQRTSPSNTFEVNGTASKSSAGDWLANSDARLKKNITELDSEATLNKLLQLQGITYEWNDNRADYERPEGVQYGFTAQNIQEVFPHLVSEDNEGYLQTSYGTYDAMYVEAIRTLYQKINDLEAQVAELSQAEKVENGED